MFGLWRCNWLPWHRPLAGSFWVSGRAEVRMCSCGRQWVTNHEMGASIPYDESAKAFYSMLNGTGRSTPPNTREET